MINYTETKICDILDSDFQIMVDELCQCIVLGKDQFENQPLSFLMMAIAREKRAITRQHLPMNGVLTMKVDKLSTDSVLYHVCRELANRKGTHIESFDGKTILSLIKQCHTAFCPKLSRLKKLTRRENDYRFKTELIKKRRRNGDL